MIFRKRPALFIASFVSLHPILEKFQWICHWGGMRDVLDASWLFWRSTDLQQKVLTVELNAFWQTTGGNCEFTTPCRFAREASADVSRGWCGMFLMHLDSFGEVLAFNNGCWLSGTQRFFTNVHGKLRTHNSLSVCKRSFSGRVTGMMQDLFGVSRLFWRSTGV